MNSTEMIPLHEIQVLTEKEAYAIIRRYYERKDDLLNYGDAIRYLNQVVLMRHFRKTGAEHWEWTRDSYFMKTLSSTHKRLLKGLFMRRLIELDENKFDYNGTKRKFKGQEIIVKIAK